MARTYGLTQNKTNTSSLAQANMKISEKTNVEISEGINADDIGDQANINVKIDEPDEVEL